MCQEPKDGTSIATRVFPPLETTGALLSSLAKQAKTNKNEAKSAFESLLQLNENLHRARGELAIVYMHLNEYDLAINQFDKVLSLTELPENVRKNILNLKVQALTELNQILSSCYGS